jgi:hypothetical protein
MPDITTPLPIGATFEKPEDVCSERPSIDVTGLRSDEIERAIRAFTLAEDADPVIASLGTAPKIGGPRGWAPVIGMSWIDFVDPELAKEEEIEIPVQVNGKLRGKVVVVPGTSEEDIKHLALSDEKVQSFVAGKQIVKVIFTGKLVSVVVK